MRNDFDFDSKSTKLATAAAAVDAKILDKCTTTLNLLKDKVIRIVLLTGRACTKSVEKSRDDEDDSNIDAPLS